MVDLTINGGSQTLDGIHSYGNVSIINGGVLYVTPYNGTGTTGTLVLNVTNNVNIDSISSINGNSRGYLGGPGGSPSVGGGAGGTGPSAGGNGESGFQCYSGGRIGGAGGGGAGYGTVGGTGSEGGGNSDCRRTIAGTGGPTYGTSNGTDLDMGSGAGGGGAGDNDPGTAGGAGGAAITINAHNITISGSILSNGGNGGIGGSAYFSSGPGGNGGGASGGGIKLRAPIINISNAVITANGGSGATTGGGGRIKIYYGSLNETGATISAGTIYHELIAQGVSLTIDGVSQSQTLYGINFFDNVNIINGGILYVTPYNGTSGTGTLTLNVANNVYIDSTSSINGVSRGYLGGGGGGPGINPGGGAGGTGPGAGGNGQTGWNCPPRMGGAGGGGAGYGTVGGIGGQGNGPSGCTHTTGGSAGPIYGTSNGTDLAMGSGAGGGGGGDNDPGTAGGAGGAAISIYAQNITVSGSILANGGDGGIGGPAYFSSGAGGSGGGASGGGIKLDAPIINIGNSIVTANGGYGATIGGGGRIKIYYGSLNETGTTISAGTIYHEIKYIVGAVITVSDIITQSITCEQCSTPPCTICNVVCPGGTCPSTINVYVTWANSGGADGTLTPTATAGGPPISSAPFNVIVPAGSTATCMFTITSLPSGLHNICIDSGSIT